MNRQLTDWSCDTGPRRAGVSSFGVGGTNAHLVLEEAPSSEVSKASGPTSISTHNDESSNLVSAPTSNSHVFPVSAKTPEALAESIDQLSSTFRDHEEQRLEDIAFTLQNGRCHFQHRVAVVADSVSQLMEQLELGGHGGA